MWSRRSRSPEAFAALIALAVLAAPARVHAQACCAGSGAVTPGRLANREVGLVGVLAKAGDEIGSYDPNGRYVPPPPGAREVDLEQDVFGAVRVLRGGQVALLVPFVQTWRTSLGESGFGGGVGDINLSGRYDFTLAGASPVVPGIALLAGVTFPTGRPSDSPGAGPLATDATGVGAFQFNGGVAFEQAYGPWLVSLTGIFAGRTARTVGRGGLAVHERLAPQWTFLAAAAYVFPSEWAVALSAGYTIEGDATIDGARAPGTAHRLPTISVSGVAPLSDVWRLQASINENPPLGGGIGENNPAEIGASFTVVRSWL